MDKYSHISMRGLKAMAERHRDQAQMAVSRAEEIEREIARRDPDVAQGPEEAAADRTAELAYILVGLDARLAHFAPVPSAVG